MPEPDLFATAHARLRAAVNGRSWRTTDPEDPTSPETIQAMQIALHIPKKNKPARSHVLEAAARAVVAVCLDERAGKDLDSSSFASALDTWYGLRIRKVARRGRNKAWEDVQMLPGVTVDNLARAFAPSAVQDVDPLLRKLQISGTDLEDDEPGPPLNSVPVIYIDASLGMSAGKAAAQAGHGSMLLAGDMDVDEARGWAERDYTLSVREVPRDVFERACTHPQAVTVTDAGYTEVAPNTVTVCALRCPLVG